MLKENLRKYKQDFNNCINDLKSIKTWYKQIPNILTISRPLGMIPANILFFTGNVIPAILLTSALLLTDLIDGKLARKWNSASKLGADLDAVCDKVMFLGMAIPIIVSQPLMLISILLEAAISSVNVLGRINGLDTKTVYSGKIKTCFLSTSLIVGYLVQLFGVPSIILKTLLLATFISQGVALRDYIKEYKKMSKLKEYDNQIKKLEDKTILEETEKKEQEKLLEELKKEKEFLLSIKEPDRVDKIKKRTKHKK